MFSGLVETVGHIASLEFHDGCTHFTITPSILFTNLIIGESIAINGVCLTVTHFTANDFSVTAVPETLRLTNLGKLQEGQMINLERALQVGSRLGGHYVQGHVDGVGHILDINHDNSDALLIKISIPSQLAKYVVNKGYITLDGMSITIITTEPDCFTVTFIPHTQAATITHQYIVGSQINIEVDIMGKYVEKLLGAYTNANTIKTS